MKTFLITGGAGFIGSHFCEFLLDKGNRVICVDNFLTSSPKNIGHLKKNKDFRFIEQDVVKPFDIDEKIDYVLHLACPPSPIDFVKMPIKILEIGSFGTYNVLELAKKKKAVFLLASTSEVYGDPLVHPQPETYWGNVNPVGPRGCYDEAKRFSEALTMAYHRFYRLDTKIVRIFNTYGPRMRLDDGRVVPAFITQALAGKPLTVFGDGSQTRSFCYVTDLVDGIYRLALSKINDPVNIGNPNEMKVIDFAEKIVSITGSRSRITFKPLPVDDPKIRQPDITKARKELGWEPKIGLDEGLGKTIEYFKNNPKK
ncbi:NAD-dependent dehydratase [Candidatus Woesearchaeota archaeon CG10_big_fil_rev_8_21_14_0_10_44_13]|nr:MAG: NAD-dependent dehydratase [Candidatus Woesearchaeota archaeon CG10_big_fil_rev_8_21_14_0_10_44_13]